jgi:hypothetical protein
MEDHSSSSNTHVYIRIYNVLLLNYPRKHSNLWTAHIETKICVVDRPTNFVSNIFCSGKNILELRFEMLTEIHADLREK